MCKAYFARLRVLTPANECNLGYGVVRTAEGTLGDEAGVTCELACYRVYLRGFQTLGQ